MTSGHLDALEVRAPEERQAQQLEALRRLLRQVQTQSDYGREVLAGRDGAALQSVGDLARWPVLRKADIAERQSLRRPLGGLVLDGGRPAKIFQSPGPIYEPEGRAPDPWRLARALVAAGVTAEDCVHNSFSYHLTPAGSMLESAALSLGCTVLPAGVGQTDLQLQATRDVGCTAYVGTPSFLRILLERAGSAPLTLRKALVSGEAFPASLRDWVRTHGIEAYQCYATADCGLIAYETSAREGLVIDEGVLVEIVRPGSGDPVPVGDVGEVVVTRLDTHYPLIRYATGDLSALMPGQSPCGRTNQRLRGWLGRADQSAKVRGLFVHAAHVQQVRERVPEITGRMRWVVEGELANDRFCVMVETEAPAGFLGDRVAEAVREVTKLRAEVQFVPSLPNDGRVIEDRRAPQ
ncbi:phenylacetate--CoA ligase family protein [Inhella gelatinilytica]|uniref:AMP-binding protein n=1 Tax=Inhella gelatinilytica TaxID=2795030 RepID=A0A931IVT8_9BURK|nr:AMP-binding protein [Inhella gelatinilytica]MBH9552491.1 AMP-binding protein [Inhella gelatinilytica]